MSSQSAAAAAGHGPLQRRHPVHRKRRETACGGVCARCCHSSLKLIIAAVCSERHYDRGNRHHLVAIAKLLFPHMTGGLSCAVLSRGDMQQAGNPNWHRVWGLFGASTLGLDSRLSSGLIGPSHLLLLMQCNPFHWVQCGTGHLPDRLALFVCRRCA